MAPRGWRRIDGAAAWSTRPQRAFMMTLPLPPPDHVLPTIDWYFDYISPFAYLASESLERLPAEVELRPRPILFAALLQHWNTLGPAEISPMRKFTFRHIRWLADRHGIELTPPPAHPFNPLGLLRLGIAAGGDIDTARRLFRFVWRDGCSAEDRSQWRALAAELGIDDVDTAIAAPEVKQALRENTEKAIAGGVFGVPSFVVDGQVFWGFDSIEFLLAYLRDTGVLDTPGMRAIDAMPEGPQRRS